MNPGNPQQDSVLLTNQFLDGTISDADLESLGNRLLLESSLRRDFADLCQLHIDLSQESVDSCADHAMQQFLGSRLPASPSLKEVKQNVLLSSSKQWSRFSAATLCGITACSVAFLLGGLWWSVRSEFATSPPQKSRTDSFPAAFTATSITLPSGSSTRMHFDKVGYATIHGPATFQMLSPMRARLEQGRIRMRVTEKSGHGFVIETPDGDITDLGTEFGVSVATGKQSALAVFEGAVDLQVADQKTIVPRIERLVGGDGVLFNKGGETTRLNSIVTGSATAFSICEASSNIEFDVPLIAVMYDNLPAGKTKRYYEIVPVGLQDDSLAFVDRLQHNWCGLSLGLGLPKYLRGADYVKTFCEDKLRTDSDFKLTVVLARPARLYVLYDKRLEPPRWLTESFRKTEDYVGLDMGKWYSLDEPDGPSREIGQGPGQSIDLEFAVWERLVKKRGAIQLGPNGRNPVAELRATMYGIAAVALYPSDKKVAKKPKLKDPIVRGESLGAKE